MKAWQTCRTLRPAWFPVWGLVLYSMMFQNSLAGAESIDEPVFWQAHRGGGAKDAPDNTMAAFTYTWNLGGIPEADIRTTEDGIIVCLHDRSLARTTTAPKDISVRDVKTLTFEEIIKWDAGIKFGDEFKGERVPSLTEVFEMMKGNPKRQVYLDLKAVDLKAVGEMIDQFEVNGQVLVASPNQADCRELKQVVEGVRTMIWIGGSPGEIKQKFSRVVESGFEGVDQVQLHLHIKRGDNPFRYQLETEFLTESLRVTRDAGIDLEVFPFHFDDVSLHGLLDIGIRWFATDEPRRFTETVIEWQN